MVGLADYEAWKAKQQQSGVGAANVVLGAVEEKPDDAALNLNVATEYARTTGSPQPPAPLVREYRNVFQQKIEEARNATILSTAPRLTEWLRNPENAAVAKDDLQGLSWWETTFGAASNAMSRGVRRIPQAYSQWRAEGAAQRLSDQSRSFGDILSDETAIRDAQGKQVGNIPIGPLDLFWSGSRYFGSRVGQLLGHDQDQIAAFYQQQAGEVAKRIEAIPMSPAGERFKAEIGKLKNVEDTGGKLSGFLTAASADPAGLTAFLLETGAESVPMIAASTAVGVAARSPLAGATTMGMMSGGQEYGTSPAEYFREQGIDVSTPDGARKAISDPDLMRDAMRRGKIRGLIIGVMDGLSGGVAGKQLAANPIANMALQSVVQAAFGAGGEAGGQVASGQKFDIVDVIVEGLAEFATAPVEVAGMGITRVREEAAKAKDAEARKALFETLSGQAQQSALRTRMPDKFRQFVDEATKDGPVANVYVPADQFVSYFQSIGVDPYSLVEEELDGVSRDDLDAALAGGGDLQIPTSTYAAKIAGSEHDAFLMENMRFDPDQMTAREAAEFNARAQDALQEAWEEAEAVRLDGEMSRSYEQEIYDTMVSNLRAAGRSTDVATTEAALWPAFYRTMAERSGKTVEEFMRQYPLPQVQGALPQGMQLRDIDELNRTLAEARARKAVGDKRVPLLEWISDYGGIDDVGGELKARDVALVKRGRGKKTLRLAREAGAGMADMFGGDATGRRHGADDVAAAAIEAGYLPDDPVANQYREALRTGSEAPDITPALWAAIDAELRGEAQTAGEASPEVARAAELDQIEEYLAGLGLSLDDDDATIRTAIEEDQDGRQYGQSTVDRGGRSATVTKVDPSTPVKALELAGLPERTSKEAIAALKEVSGTYRTASGEEVTITPNATRKALSSNANAIKRSLVGEFGQIIGNSVVYGESEDFSYAASYVRIEGKDIAVRLAIRKIADGSSRLYQLEGVELDSDWSPRQGSNLQRTSYEEVALPVELQGDRQTISEPFGDPRARSASDATATVSQLVDAFNSLPPGAFPLFQDMSRPRGLIQFPAGGVGNGDTIVRLFETADLSTFVHESGHYFLAVMQDLAARGEAGSVEDFATVKGWWRENAAEVAKDGSRAMPDAAISEADVIAAIEAGTTGDTLKDAAVDVGMQEQWARAFETYVMEGKAPSTGLRAAFEKMRSWLLSVYRRLAGLNVAVSDDLRAVFDRMLATDDEIAKAQQEAGGREGVFATAAEMGLTEEEFGRLLKLRQQAEDAAKARLLKETMAPIRRAREKEFKAEKARVADEVAREVNAYPMYRAIEWMGNRRWLGDGQPEEMPDIRLSKSTLVERYGDGVLKTLPRGKQTVYAVEGGLDPDEAAGWFGFGSGDEMVRAMERAPRRQDAIAAETDRVMNERHGDVLNDGTVEAEALDAVHGDKRGQWIAAELKAISEVADAGVSLTAKGARATARQTVARMRVRDAMNANRFLAAERKAAAEAARLGAILARDSVWLQNATRRMEAKARAAAKGKATVGQVNAAIDRRNAMLESSDVTFTVPERTAKTKGGERTLPSRQQTTHLSGYNENVAKLVDAKRRQLLNHSLYMEARRVADEVEKGERFVRKLTTASTRERIAGAGRRDNAEVDYLGAIDDILQRYDFTKMSSAAESRRGSLNAFVEAMRLAGRENELAIPDDVLMKAARAPYKTIPVEEFRGVIDTLKNLEHVASRWDKLIDAQQQRAFDEVVSGVLNAFDENVPKRPPGRVGTRGEAIRKAGRQFLDLVLNASTILREIDGREDGGATYRAIKAPIDAAMSRLITRKQKAATDLEALYSVYSKAERRAMSVREHIPALGYALSKWERIAVALNMGNDGNRQRLTDQRVRGSLTEDQAGAVLATLDARDADFVQSVWDYVGSFRDDIAARERRTTGVEPEWVDAVPVEIGGKMLRGGYYPLKYDPRLSSLARDDQANDVAAALQAGRFGKAQTRNGHTKARSGSSGRDVELDMSVLHRHVNQVVYDLELSEPVANSWRVLQNGDVRSAFIEAGKTADFDALEIWLKDVAEGEVKSGDIAGVMARTMKSNFTAAKLAFNLSTVLMQITGVAQSMVVVGKRDFARGVQASFRAGIGDEIAAKSSFMSTRQTTFNKDIYDMHEDPKTGPIMSRWSEARNAIAGTLGFWLMTKVQWYLVDIPTWMAGYQQGLRRFGNDEARAIAHADDIVKRSQASGLFSDRSAVERGSVSRTARQNDVVRLFTTLGSYMFAKFNVAYERTQGTAETIREEGISLRSAQEALSWSVDMAFLFTLEAVLMGALKGKLPGQGDDDDEEGWLKFLAKETGLAVMGTVPFIRDGASAFQGFSGGGAYGGIVEDATKMFKGLWGVASGAAGDDDVKLSAVKQVINGTGLATGLPATQINRVVDAGWRQSEGKDVSPLEYLIGKLGKSK